MTALNEIIDSIKAKKNFVLQGGAGSGKTETLKQLLEYLSETHSGARIACITHTNLAVDEIRSRVGDTHTISTIHSLLHATVKDYKKNIHQHIFSLFRVDEVISDLKDHDAYKRAHRKYSSRIYTVKKERAYQVAGKKDYDKDYARFNSVLNTEIQNLNGFMQSEIATKDPNQIKYNETSFDNYTELSYGHDGLLYLAHKLFVSYPKLSKIIRDKFDFIFIDEYQDTRPEIVEIFLKYVANENSTLVGLFGDSMQAIYADGIGNAQSYVTQGLLNRVDKEDNYRCSEQVITFINQLRNDGLTQKVAFKKIDGKEETAAERQGKVKFYYAICDTKPHARSTQEEKDSYIQKLDKLIEKCDPDKAFRTLKLTNKSIAHDAGFPNLFLAFSNRYTDPQDHLERHLERLQFKELNELLSFFEDGQYNSVLSTLKNNGLHIKKKADKRTIRDALVKVSTNKASAMNIIEEAFSSGLLTKSDSHSEYLEERDAFLVGLQANAEFQKFKKSYNDGQNTLKRMNDAGNVISEDEFEEFKSFITKETFYNEFFSDSVTNLEIKSYYDYMKEKKRFITMHKTKGTGIDNVLVVLDEYFWNEYDFNAVFVADEGDLDKKHKNQKLIYVACSRAKSNLTCARMIKSTELESYSKFFSEIIKVEVEDKAA